jgi:hypothetical protein
MWQSSILYERGCFTYESNLARAVGFALSIYRTGHKKKTRLATMTGLVKCFGFPEIVNS